MQARPLKDTQSRSTSYFVLLAAFTFSTAGFCSAQQAAPPPPQATNLQPKSQAVSSATPSPTAQPQAAPPHPFDSADRNKAIVQHLNSVLRFYHDAGAPAIQTVGEPSDLIYRDQVLTVATQIAGYAFQSAKAEAALTANASPVADPAQSGQSQAQNLQKFRDQVTQRIAQLKAQDADLETKLATARKRDIAALQ